MDYFLYNRKDYISKFNAWLDKPVIKIITGIRRAGKSTLMQLFINELLAARIPQKRIVYINMESIKFEFIQNYKQLYEYVEKKYQEVGEKLYLFVDEIQNISKWEKAILSFFTENMADIFISGSNSNLMSQEFATLLSGRSVRINIYPLTYSEFLLFRGSKKSDDIFFEEFLKYGGLPGIHHLNWEKSIIFEYLDSVYSTIILKDIVKRYSVRNVAFLEKVINFIFGNIAQIFSAKRVVDFLKKEHRRTNTETVYNYIKYLENTFIIQRVPRYDIKGKRLLEVREKYYLTDIGLRHAVIGYNKDDINQLLENILFIEFKKRGYKIYIGQIGNAEIDFIIMKENQKAYVQVCYLLASEKTIEREFSSLLAIQDNYPKYVMSLDNFFPKDNQGILHLNIIDYLLNDEILLER